VKVITLRKLPPELARAVRRRAETDRASLSRTVIRLLEEHLGGAAQAKHRPLYHDLDHLAGRWSRKQAAEFEKALAAQRKIDPELWK